MVRQDDRVPRGAARARPRAPLAPAVHGRALRELGRRPERRLVRQPPAVLRRAVPGLVPARRGRASRDYDASDRGRARLDCRSIRRRTCPTGYTQEQRGQPGGFVGDPDVMDTWATSSLTPQIVGGWEDDPDLFARVFPMDLRPQAHDIIRTWLFYTVLRVALEHDSLPWTNAAISGWVLDPDRKKMSKSKGNVVTPIGAARGARLRRACATGRRARGSGIDTAFDEQQMKVGRRLAIKMLNASQFALCSRASRGRDHRRRSTARCSRRCAASWTRRRRRSRTTSTRARSSCDGALLLGLLRRLPRAGEAARVRRQRARGAPASAIARAARSRSTSCCGCSRRSCRSSPRRSGRGGRRARSTARAWPSTEEFPVGGDAGRLRGGRRGARRGPQGEGAREGVAAHRRRAPRRPRHAGAAEDPARRRARRREAGKVRSVEYVEATEPSVEVELAPEE